MTTDLKRTTGEIREHILGTLPEFEHFPRRCEPDAYGASYLIAQELGMNEVPESTATWTHGWPYMPVVHPEQVAQQSNAEQTNLVPTEEIAETLRTEFSYRNVHAVGCPFIYAEPLEVERIPNSLLVMPPHTLPYLEDEWDEEAYVAAIEGIKDQFEHVVACIHRHDIKKGNWVGAFSNAGIPHVPGTRVRDKYGLVRMHTLFHSFEAVTANTIGSHIAYAAYCGCKISIYGPYAHRSLSDFKKDPVWSGEREPILQHNLRHSREQSVRDRYPFLFASPTEASRHIDWARKELGHRHKKGPEELEHLLGWGTIEQLKLKGKKYKDRIKAKVRSAIDKIGTVDPS